MTVSSLLAANPIPFVVDARKTSVALHAYLRGLIMSGAFPPGTVLKQAELAKLLPVSRTPMREAFRMLQEEGLIEADVNQRARVTGFEPEALDALYAARIALECLGVQITVGGLTTEEIKEGRRLLNAMKRAALADEIDVWSTLHRRFHAILVARSGAFVGRTIATYAAQSERYWRVYRSTHPSPLVSRHSEHERLLMAVTAGDRAEAGNLMAEHLSTTALAVLADIDPDFSPESVRCAVDLVATRAYGGRQTRPDPQTVDGPF